MHPGVKPQSTRRPPSATIVLLASFLGLLLESAPQEAGACRFWGLVGGRYPRDLVRDHLRDGSVTNLKELGGGNRDGWGFGYFLRRSSQPQPSGPICLRGGTPANHPEDPDYDLAVDELSRLRPRSVLGHVRAGTSGHWGIPNPHPFEHEGIIFAHNGVLSEGMLVGLLTADDARYLERHPPDYVNGNIDSELYFLYILKSIHQQPGGSKSEGIIHAVREIERVSPGCRLNFVMTAGDTLYALRYSAYDEGDPVRYYPGNVPTSFYWVAASTVMGSDREGWGTIPARSLGVFVGRRRPVFIPVDAPEPLGDERSAIGPRIGVAWPNPARDSVEIPAFLPPEGADVTLMVIDPQGRLIREDGPRWYGPGQAQIRWDGRAHDGRRVASGSYFLRVQIGAVERRERITLVR
jgi:predicted glutamine amidotransferase